MARDKWLIKLNKFYQGFSPIAQLNSLTDFGNFGHASAMQNIDILDPTHLTQGPGLSNLTNGTQAGVVDELINFIMDVPVASGVAYGIGPTKLFQISSTTVSSGGSPSWPRTVLNMTDGQSVAYLRANTYYFYNTASAGDIGRFDNTSTFDDDWGCLNQGTEVLTVEGWKRIEDVKIGQKVYSLNPKTHEVEITNNNKTINKSFRGKC